MTDDHEHSRPSRSSMPHPLTPATLDAGHRMFQRYLESAYPEALSLADEVLLVRPEDAMALAVRRECVAALGEVRDREPTAPDLRGDATDADTYDDVTPAASSIAPARSGEHASEMYERFLAGDFRAALALSEQILDGRSEDDLARAVRSQCCDALGIEARVPALRRSSAEHRAVVAPPPTLAPPRKADGNG